MTGIESGTGFNPGGNSGYGVSLPGESGYVPPPPGASGSRPVGPTTPRLYAPRVQMGSFFTRWVGQFVDGLVVMLVPMVIFIAGVSRIPTYMTTCEAWDPTTGGVTQIPCTQPEIGPFMALLGFVALIWMIAFFMVVISPIGISGQSIGMRMMGVRAVDQDTLRPIGLGRSFARALSAWFLSGWFSLGYLWAIIDSRNQTWHDKIAHTVVVQD